MHIIVKANVELRLSKMVIGIFLSFLLRMFGPTVLWEFQFSASSLSTTEAS